MKKILITGALGLVGSEAMDFFVEKEWDTFGIDNRMRAKLFNIKQERSKYVGDIDIRNQKAVNEMFELLGPWDAIIHTAAQPSHDWSQKDPLTDFDINARGTLILLEATRKYCPEAVFVHVSTDKVYGGNMARADLYETETRYDHWLPFDEKLSIDQAIHSPFGCSKAAADLYVQEYGLYFGMKTACFRPGCITGRRHKGAEAHGFLANLARCIKSGETFKLAGFKGKQVRDQIHSYDLVNAFYHFIQKPGIAKVYNMGGGEDRSVSVLEAVKLIEEETGKKAIIQMVEERKGDRIWDIHDVSKFRKDYPEWDYKYSLQDIIKDLCAS